MRIWGETIKKFSKSLANYEDRGIFGTLSEQSKLVALFRKMLCLTREVPLQVENCIISTSEESKVDDVLNEIKIKIIKSLNIFVPFLFGEENSPEELQDAPLLELFVALIQIMLNSMIEICTTDKFNVLTTLSVSSYYHLYSSQAHNFQFKCRILR